MKIRKIAFDGGGVKGIAHCGAMDALKAANLLGDVHIYCGSSIGAVMAGLYACKIEHETIKDIAWNIDFNRFRDDNWGIIRDIYRFVSRYGYYRSDQICEYYRGILQKHAGNGDITFAEVKARYGNDLYITATKIMQDSAATIYFGPERHGEMRVCDAVKYSSAYPFFFEALPFEDGVIVDGGVLNNFPLEFLGDDAIGVRLLSRTEITPTRMPPRNIKDYTFSLINALYTQAEKYHSPPEIWARTIDVDTGDISALKLGLTQEDRKMLYDSGMAGAKKFIAKNHFTK